MINSGPNQARNSSPTKPENAWLNILMNVIIPVTLLNKGSQFLGPVGSLVAALLPPLIYGVWDLWKRKNVNYFSLFGILNVALTGGFALAHLTGIWFAVKEALFPALLSIFALGSCWTKKPLIETILIQPHVFRLEMILDRITSHSKESEYRSLLTKSTFLLASSFFLSSALNFFLALRIFSDIPDHLDSQAKSELLNQQIAQMTSTSFAVIMVPSIAFLAFILWYILKELSRLTQLKIDELMVQ